jgi:hypothetical protein
MGFTMADLQHGFYSDPSYPQPTVVEIGDGAVVIIDTEGEDGVTLDEATGASITDDGEGGVEINLSPDSPNSNKDTSHTANLADLVDEGELAIIAAELLDAIAADEQSRKEWLDTRAEGIDLLGFKLEKAKTDTSSGPAPGMSVVRNPVLAEAVIRFQANAGAELYPAEGPVKVRDDSTPPPESEVAAEIRDVPDGTPGAPAKPPTGSDLAEALEKDMNHFLTVTDKGYRPDSIRMLFWVGFGGCGFKKVYNDPIRRMPTSRAVDASDIIISNSANDIDDCGRITHKISMRPSTLKRMQIAGVYRDIYIGAAPWTEPNAVDEKKAEVSGFEVRQRRQQDQDHTIYECYCELNIKGFEHRDDKGKFTGLQLPYRVTIEKDSQQILEIRRNWAEDDPNYIAKKVFVKFPFIPAMGFFDIGLLHLLGNSTRALTAAWREALDAGMFASFPGFLYSEGMSRQTTNEFRVPPGGGAQIKTGGKPLSEVVMPLPYKDPSSGLLMLAKDIEASAQRIGGTAELQVAEGRQEAPVGTTLAMIEQATKMVAAVHINLHAAQSEEFQLLRDCFREDPSAFWRFNKRPTRQWEIDEFLQALDNCDLVPAADPNTPSRMHRIMKAMAIKQLQQASPQLYDAAAVDSYILRVVGVSDPYTLFASLQAQQQASQPPPPDATKMAAIQAKSQDAQAITMAKAHDTQVKAQQADKALALKAQQAQDQAASDAADRASKEQIAARKEESERLKVIGSAVQSGALPAEYAAAAATGQPMDPGLGQPHVPPVG